MKGVPYNEGTWFTVPLRTGGYAAGLVARMAPKGRILVAYFFGPKRTHPLGLADVVSLNADDAIKVLRVGDLGLVTGEWKIIGEQPNWHKEHWPVPAFVRRDDLCRRAWRTIYQDADPSKIEREDSISYEAEGLERDALYGSGAAELLLTKLLGQ